MFVATGRRRLLTLNVHIALRMLCSLQPKTSNASTLTSVSKKDIRQFAPGSSLKQFIKEVDAVGSGRWVVRKEALDTLDKLKLANKRRVLFYGGDGNGKTTAMSQVAWHCFQSNWFCIHVPSVFSWTHSRKDVRPSLLHPGLYDQPGEATQWLKNLKSMNTAFLNQFVTSREHVFSKKESCQKGETWMNVIETGLVKPLIATEVVRAVIDEVLLIANKQEVLLAVDELNGMFSPTTLKSTTKDWLSPDELSLVHHTKKLCSEESPVAVVAALSRTGMRRCPQPSTDADVLLGPQGSKELSQFSQVLIPPFTYKELSDYLHHQSTSGWYTKGNERRAHVEQAWALTGGNPKELARLLM